MASAADLPSSIPDALRPVRALFFDLLGTTLSWLEPVVLTLESYGSRTPALSSKTIDWSAFAYAWRGSFFKVVGSQPPASAEHPLLPQIEVYVRALDLACEQFGIKGVWTREEMEEMYKCWWKLEAWPDTRAGVELLKTKYDCVGLTNGATAYLIHINKQTGVSFDLLLTSDLLGAYKPNPIVYEKSLALIQYKPEECAMIASHAYDLEAAKQQGMRTIYIHRETEDVGVDLAKFTFDLSIGEGGLVELARRLGVEA